MKQKLCEELLENGIEENSVIRHSYTSNRLTKGKKNLKRTESKDKGLAPTLDTRCDCLGIATKRYKNYITWKNKKGEFNTECNRASLPNDLALTVATANIGKVIDNAREREREQNSLAIRKLTPFECLKLMGFEKQDYEAMRKIGMTDMQIYHCAGDSIVVSVLMGIFGELLQISDYEEKINGYAERVAKNE